VDEHAWAGGALVKRKQRANSAAALILSTLCAWGLPATEAAAESLEQSFEVAPDVSVDIEIVSGQIELRAIEASEVRVRAEGGIEAHGSRSQVSLRAPSTGWLPWARGTDVDLVVEVPRKSHITARTVNGRIKAEDVEGELRLHAANGQIEVKGAPQQAYLETLTSAIKFQGEHSEVVARTLNGEIELSGVSREVEAASVSGRIRVEGDEIERAELRSMSGEIELDSSLAKGARVDAKSYSGQVRLRLPENTSARFEVQSFSGGVHSEFVSQLTDDQSGYGPWSFGPGRRLSFVVGDGDARISIESFSGGVRIERGAE